jgi:hypothetical protein
MPSQGKYTDEQVRAILDRALRAEPDHGMSHDELVAIASQVGVSPESIETAARELHLEAEREQSRRQVLRRRRGQLASHAFTFAAVNAFLFAVNYLTTPGQWWVLFPVFIWGLVLIFHARFALSHEVSVRALLKEQRRAAREERHALAERNDLAAPKQSGSRSMNAHGPHARVAETPAASESEAEPEPQAELEGSTADVGRRRD